ncbi:MAG TPA: hypothetical protein VFE67_14280 [Rudaea sp.]|nr:hypothetical protein [Rudaea sp.]
MNAVITNGIRASLLLAASALLALTSCDVAAVICSPLPVYVGPAADSSCKYHTIKEAIDATNASTCPIEFDVSDDQTYPNEVVTIANRTVTIKGSPQCGAVIGGTPNPDSLATAAPKVTVGGDGAHSVFTITGTAHVTLSNLAIGGGYGGTSDGGGGVSYSGSGNLNLTNVALSGNNAVQGGGVAYSGSGFLRLDGVSISGNHASNFGGGVSVTGSAGHVEATIVDDPALPTAISSNISTLGGGGIFATGDVHLRATAAGPGRVAIYFNQAGETGNINGTGGGLLFGGSAFADIALPGNSMFSNIAGFGGAIALSAYSPSVVLRLFSADALNPTILDSNSAAFYGGAVYVGAQTVSGHATACLFDTSLTTNHAPGLGVAVFVDGGGRLAVNPSGDPDCDYNAVAALGAQHCAAITDGCNRFGNNTETSGGTPAVVDAGDGSTSTSVLLRRVRISANTAHALVRASVATFVDLDTCLVDHNDVSENLIEGGSGGLTIDDCTFADNSFGGGTALKADSQIIMSHSIVHESKPVLSYSGPAAGRFIENVIANEVATLPNNDNSVLVLDPGFVNATIGNYHLAAGSAAIDFALSNAGPRDGDFDYQPREVDLSGVSNRFGLRDLGPFEYQVDGVLDRIFYSPFD